jgi:hypothetical protein
MIFSRTEITKNKISRFSRLLEKVLKFIFDLKLSQLLNSIKFSCQLGRTAQHFTDTLSPSSGIWWMTAVYTWLEPLAKWLKTGEYDGWLLYTHDWSPLPTWLKTGEYDWWLLYTHYWSPLPRGRRLGIMMVDCCIRMIGAPCHVAEDWGIWWVTAVYTIGAPCQHGWRLGNMGDCCIQMIGAPCHVAEDWGIWWVTAVYPWLEPLAMWLKTDDLLFPTAHQLYSKGLRSCT